MSDEKNTPNLFKKMATMVQKVVNAGDHSQPMRDVDEPRVPKPNLAESLEQKRQNEQVKNFEFDQLRKIRSGHGGISPTVHFSEYGPTKPGDLKERSGTIDKIDKIESELSNQWGTDTSSILSTLSTDGQSTHCLDGSKLDFDNLITLPGEGGVAEMGGGSTETPQNKAEQEVELGVNRDLNAASPAANTENNLLAGLDTAAFYFAHANYEGCEKNLWEQLEQLKIAGAHDALYEELLVESLLVLYHTQGLPTKGEALLTKFDQPLNDKQIKRRKDWSALYQHHQSDAKQIIECKVERFLTMPGLMALSEKMEVAMSAEFFFLIQWCELESVSIEVIPMLSEFVKRLMDSGVAFQFQDVHQLQSCLQQLFQLPQVVTIRDYWLLCMDIETYLGCPDKFDLLALDYCMKFGEACPLWQEFSIQPCPSVKKIAMKGDDGIIFNGEVMGDISMDLAQIPVKGKVLILDFQRCRRVDFAAVGCMLDWVEQLRQQEIRLQMVSPHPLLAAFFVSVGLGNLVRP